MDLFGQGSKKYEEQIQLLLIELEVKDRVEHLISILAFTSTRYLLFVT